MKFWNTVKSFILWLSVPIQKFLQRSGHDEPHMNMEQAKQCLDATKDGRIVLTFENGRPTAHLIPGPWDHTAIVSSKKTIIEAVGDLYKDGLNVGGVREVDALEFYLKKDNVCIIDVEYVNKDLSYIPKTAGADSLSFVGKAYDYYFSLDTEKLYCSELPYACYRISDFNFMNHISEDKQILPTDYYKMAKTGKTYGNCKFKIVKEIINI